MEVRRNVSDVVMACEERIDSLVGCEADEYVTCSFCGMYNRGRDLEVGRIRKAGEVGYGVGGVGLPDLGLEQH